MHYELYEKLKLYKQFYPEKAETVTQQELDNTIAEIAKGGILWEHYYSQVSSVVSSSSVSLKVKCVKA